MTLWDRLKGERPNGERANGERANGERANGGLLTGAWLQGDWRVGRHGQVLALAATLLVCLLVWEGGVQPLLGWYADRAETLRQQRALAERMERLVASLPALRTQIAAGPASRTTAGVTLNGPTDAVASAILQERVQAMAGSAAATLSSIETLPADSVGSWRRIGLRVTLTSQWPVLMHLLQAVDTATPRMLVDDLHVHSVSSAGSPAAGWLLSSFVIYAYRADAGPKSGAGGSGRGDAGADPGAVGSGRGDAGADPGAIGSNRGDAAANP